MAADVNYDRKKVATTNVTPLNVAFTGAEEPTAATTLLGPATDNTGSTGIFNLIVTGDADESGGADVQDLFRVEDIQVTITQGDDGTMTLTMVVTPVKGDATDGTPITLTATHDETADAWQTAAGRARQA